MIHLSLGNNTHSIQWILEKKHPTHPPKTPPPQTGRVTDHFGVSQDEGVRSPDVQQLLDQLCLGGQPGVVELDQPAQQHHGLVLQLCSVDHWGHTHCGRLQREGDVTAIILITKVFRKCKILSIDCSKHKHANTHTHTHTHMGTCTHEHMDYTKLNLHTTENRQQTETWDITVNFSIAS